MVMPISPQILQGIANPPIGDFATGFRQNVEEKAFNEETAEVLKNTIGSKYADLIKIDPERGLNIAQAVGVLEERDETLKAARLKNVVGTLSLANDLVKTGNVPPEELGQLLLEQGKVLASRNIPVDFMIDAGTKLINGTPEEQQAEMAAFGQLVDSFSVKGEKFSPKTEILKSTGASIQTTSTGRVIVKDPEGNTVTGKQASAIIRQANEEGIRLQTERAGGRAGATGKERRASELITRGTAAAESTAVIRRGLELLDTVKTGGVAAVSLAVKQRLGIEGANEGELSNSLGKAVLSQLRETFGAAFTENEGLRLDRIEANFSKSPESNRRLLTQALRIAERTAKRARKAAKDRDQGDVVQDIDELLTFSLGFEAEEQAPAPSRFQIEVIE